MIPFSPTGWTALGPGPARPGSAPRSNDADRRSPGRGTPETGAGIGVALSTRAGHLRTAPTTGSATRPCFSGCTSSSTPRTSRGSALRSAATGSSYMAYNEALPRPEPGDALTGEALTRCEGGLRCRIPLLPPVPGPPADPYLLAAILYSGIRTSSPTPGRLPTTTGILPDDVGRRCSTASSARTGPDFTPSDGTAFPGLLRRRIWRGREPDSGWPSLYRPGRPVDPTGAAPSPRWP